jgi:hypothetical protein
VGGGVAHYGGMGMGEITGGVEPSKRDGELEDGAGESEGGVRSKGDRKPRAIGWRGDNMRLSRLVITSLTQTRAGRASDSRLKGR